MTEKMKIAREHLTSLCSYSDTPFQNLIQTYKKNFYELTNSFRKLHIHIHKKVVVISYGNSQVRDYFKCKPHFYDIINLGQL